MTDEIQKSHSDVEDEPKADVDTSLAMYEQSKAVVAGGTERAERLLGEAGAVLEEIYNAASAAQNTDLMAQVNAAYAKTQELAQIVGQHNAALNGADVVIDVMKESRDAALDELNNLIKGLDQADTSLHPKLQEFEEYLSEMIEDDMSWYWEDTAFDRANEQQEAELYSALAQYVEHPSSGVRRAAVRNFIALIYDNKEKNAEQKELLKKLLETCRPRLSNMPGIPPEEAAMFEDDDDFEDEDDE